MCGIKNMKRGMHRGDCGCGCGERKVYTKTEQLEMLKERKKTMELEIVAIDELIDELS